MAQDSLRHVSLTRTGPASFRATNVRGGRIEVDAGNGDNFSPVELLLVAMGACSGLDVDALTSRRAEPSTFDVAVQGDKLRDDNGNHMDNIVISFKVSFPEGPQGDAARAVLPDAVQRSHDRLCTVTRTVILPTTVSTVVDG